MKKLNWKGCILGLSMIIFYHGAADAALEIWLEPASTQTVILGTSASIDLWMDATITPTTGGGLDIAYNKTILGFNSFTLNPELYDDPVFRNLPTNWDGGLDALNFGNYSGFNGKYKVGTILFNSIGTGITNVINSESPNNFWAGFYDTNGDEINPIFRGTTVVVTSNVPEPSVFILVASGLGIIGIFSRFKKVK